MAEKDSDSKLMAGLCYVPFLLINVIAIVYVLLTKKGGPYARFHALQALALFILAFILGAVMTAFMFSQMITMQQSIFAASVQTPATTPAAMSATMTQFFSAFMPYLFVSLLAQLLLLVLGVLVALGRDIRLPLIRDFANRFI